VFLTISTLGICILLPILCCLMMMHPLNAIACAMLGLCLLAVALAAWIIYGYVIYFSDDNDCQK
jgi:ammonia channel protein AmtB